MEGVQGRNGGDRSVEEGPFPQVSVMRCGSVTSREIAYAKTWRSFWSRTIGEIWASCPVCTEQSVTGEFSPNWKRGDEDSGSSEG